MNTLSTQSKQELAEIFGDIGRTFAKLEKWKNDLVLNGLDVDQICRQVLNNSDMMEHLNNARLNCLEKDQILGGGLGGEYLLLALYTSILVYYTSNYTSTSTSNITSILASPPYPPRGDSDTKPDSNTESDSIPDSTESPKRSGRRRFVRKNNQDSDSTHSTDSTQNLDKKSGHRKLALELLEIIANAHGQNQDWIQKKIRMSVKYMGRLLKLYDAKTLKDAVEWAMEDPFWSRQVLGVAGLACQSPSNPDLKKIELIVLRMRESKKTEEQKAKEALALYVNRHYPDEFENVMKDVAWFQEKVASFEPVDRQANWQYTSKMVEVLKWLTKMEKTLVAKQRYKIWSDVMASYFKYLETEVFPKLKHDRVLGIGWFKDGPAFKAFQDYIEEKVGYTIFSE